MAMSSTAISTQELAKHNTANDVWIAVNGNVYDVTNYLSSHPGGDNILLGAGGGDATEAFEDVGHSDDAAETMSAMKVGSLSGWVSNHSAKEIATFVAESLPSVSEPDSGAAMRMRSVAIYFCGTAILIWIMTALSFVDLRGYSGISLSFNTGLIGLLGSGSIGTVAFLRWLQKTLLSHPELHHFPILIEHRPERKAIEVSSEPSLSKHRYRPLELVEKRRIGNDAWKLRMAFPDQLSKAGISTGQHVSVKASVDGKTVSRSYTPISQPSDTGSLELAVKVYEDGVMGKHLQGLPLGSQIDVRGPQGRFQYRRNASKTLICIAGGSGITPMFNVIQQICLDERDETEVLLLYANRSESGIMLKQDLAELQSRAPEKLRIVYLVSRPDEGSGLEPVRLSREYLREALRHVGGSTKYLVCGPDGMVEMVRESLAQMQGVAGEFAAIGSENVHVF